VCRVPSHTYFLLRFLQAQTICDEALDFIEADEERLRLLRPAPKLRRLEREWVGNAVAATGDGRLRRMRTNLDDEAVVEIFLARLSSGQLLYSLNNRLHAHQSATTCIRDGCVLDGMGASLVAK